MSAKEIVAVTVEAAEANLTSFLSAPVEVQLAATGNFVRANPAACGPVAAQVEKILGRFLAGLALQAKNAGHLEYDGLTFSNPGGEEEKAWRAKGATDAKTDLSDEALEKASATVTGSVDGDGVHVKAKEFTNPQKVALRMEEAGCYRKGSAIVVPDWPTPVRVGDFAESAHTLLESLQSFSVEEIAKGTSIWAKSHKPTK